MWARSTTDPLARLLFDKYDVHVLSRPRSTFPVLTVFGVRDGKVYLGGTLSSLLRLPFEEPAITRGEPMLDIASTASNATSGSVAVNFLRGFLAMLGAGIGVSIGASLERSRTQAIKFRFDGCSLDSVTDAFDLENRLSDLTFDREKSAMRDGVQYYLARGVHSCTSLTFEALDKRLATIDMKADVVAVGDAKASLSVNKDGTVTAASTSPLAYGVVLNELVYDTKRKRLGLKEAREYVHVMAARDARMPGAVIGNPDDTVLTLQEGTGEGIWT